MHLPNYILLLFVLFIPFKLRGEGRHHFSELQKMSVYFVPKKDGLMPEVKKRENTKPLDFGLILDSDLAS